MAPQQQTTRTNERDLPCDMDAEMGILGAMLLSLDAIDEATQVITDADAFTRTDHQVLYELLRDMRADGKKVDFITVGNELKRRGKLEFIDGGMQYLITLAESFAQVANVPYYAKIAWEAHQKRRLIQIAGQLREQAYSPTTEAADLVAEFAPQLDSAGVRNASNEPRKLKDIADTLPEWWERTQSDSILTGITALDDSLGGLERPSLVIVGARPSVGKSAFLLHLAKQAGRSGIPVLFFVLEAGEMRTAQRFAANLVGQSTGFLRRNASPQDRRFAVDVVRNDSSGENIYLTDKHITLQDILATSRLYVRRRGVKMVIVDYLQIVQYVGKAQTRDLELGRISRGLSRLALDNDVQVTTAAQLLRPDRNQKTEKPPKLSDLRESGNMEQDADMVILLHRLVADRYSERMVKDVDIDVIVAKNKDGPTPAFTLRFNKPTFRFSAEASVAQDEEQQAPAPPAQVEAF